MITVGMQFICLGNRVEVVAVRGTQVFMRDLDSPKRNSMGEEINGLRISYRWFDYVHRIESGLEGGEHADVFRPLPLVNTPTTQFGDDT